MNNEFASILLYYYFYYLFCKCYLMLFSVIIHSIRVSYLVLAENCLFTYILHLITSYFKLLLFTKQIYCPVNNQYYKRLSVNLYMYMYERENMFYYNCIISLYIITYINSLTFDLLCIITAFLYIFSFVMCMFFFQCMVLLSFSPFPVISLYHL